MSWKEFVGDRGTVTRVRRGRSAASRIACLTQRSRGNKSKKMGGRGGD